MARDFFFLRRLGIVRVIKPSRAMTRSAERGAGVSWWWRRVEGGWRSTMQTGQREVLKKDVNDEQVA